MRLSETEAEATMAPEAPTCRFRVFGGPEMTREGKVIPLSPQQGALLGVLLGSGKPSLTRQEVVSIFWPDEDPSRARKRLNQLLYSIKKKTRGSSPFQVRGDSLSPARDRMESDFVELQSALENRDLLACTALLERGFLAKTPVTLGRDLHDWIDARKGELRSRVRKKAEGLWQEGSRTGEWRLALVGAEALLSLAPLDEGRLRRVLEAMGKAGFPGGVEGTVEEFAQRFRDEVEVAWSPDEKTKELLETIESAQEVELLPSPGNLSDPQPEPPLLGRDEERDLLRRTLRRAPHQALRAILITGEAGIGKTRLVQESLRGIPMEGQGVYPAGSAELEQLIPLNPLIEALRSRRVGEVLRELEEPWRTVLFGVMPAHYLEEGPIPDPPHIQPGSVPRRLFEAFHQLLLALTEAEPAIIVLDDLQWADQTTLSLLEFLVRRWDRGGLQLVILIRSEEIRKNRELGQFLETIRIHEDFLEVNLGDLTPAASEALVRDLSPNPLTQNEVAHLRSLAGGIPFFLIELTLEYLAGRVDAGVPNPDELTIPLSIRQVLQRRWAQLSGDAERILETLAVHSKPLEIKGLARIARVSGSRCLSSLDQLQEFRLVTSRTAEVMIRHELIRQAVYRQMSDPRKALLHERTGRHILRRGGRLPADELAIHFHRAGAKEEARTYSIEAANKAEASGAVAEALRFLRIAREHSEDPHEVAELIGRMGHLNYLHQNLEEAAPLLELAAQRLRREGEVGEALRAELERIDALTQIEKIPLQDSRGEIQRIKREAQETRNWEIFQDALDVEAHQLDRLGDLEGLRGILGEAKRHSGHGNAHAKCKAQAMTALNIYFGSAKESLPAARKAVQIAKTTTDNYLILHASNRLIVVLHYLGRLDTPEGTKTLSDAENRLGTCGDLILKYRIRLNRAVWYLEVGDLDQARIAFDAAAQVIRGTNARDAKAKLHLNLGELSLFEHDIPGAREEFLKAEAYFSQNSPHLFSVFFSAGMGLCALYEGDLPEARRREAELPEIPKFWTYDPTLFVTFKARMLRLRGDLRELEELLDGVRAEIDGRLRVVWIRITLEEARLLRTADAEKARRLASLAVTRSSELGLNSMVKNARSFGIRAQETK